MDFKRGRPGKDRPRFLAPPCAARLLARFADYAEAEIILRLTLLFGDALIDILTSVTLIVRTPLEYSFVVNIGGRSYWIN